MRKAVNPVVAVIVIVVVLVVAWLLLSKLTGKKRVVTSGGQVVDAQGRPIEGQQRAQPGPRFRRFQQGGGQQAPAPGGPGG